MWTFFFQKLEAKVRTKSFFLKWTVLSNLVRQQDHTDSISKIWLGRLASLRQEAFIVNHKNFIGFHKHVQREGEEQGCLYCHLPSDPADCETHQIIIVRKLINTTINTVCSPLKASASSMRKKQNIALGRVFVIYLFSSESSCCCGFMPGGPLCAEDVLSLWCN